VDQQTDLAQVEDQRQRDLRRTQQLRREKNALTIMPLPVRVPASWYEILPRVLPLIPTTPDVSKHYIPAETIEQFGKMWSERLMRREGDCVWMRLGGVESYETIPAFARTVATIVKARDAEIKESQGLKGLLDHWRDNAVGMSGLDDKAILEARMQILRDLEPATSTLTFSAAWGEAFERSRENMVRIRPVLQRWVEEHGHEWDLGEPFGGKLTRTI
jgi:hypothetical protein